MSIVALFPRHAHQSVFSDRPIQGVSRGDQPHDFKKCSRGCVVIISHLRVCEVRYEKVDEMLCLPAGWHQLRQTCPTKSPRTLPSSPAIVAIHICLCRVLTGVRYVRAQPVPTADVGCHVCISAAGQSVGTAVAGGGVRLAGVCHKMLLILA